MSEDQIVRKKSGSIEDQGAAINGNVKTASQTPGMQKE